MTRSYDRQQEKLEGLKRLIESWLNAPGGAPEAFYDALMTLLVEEKMVTISTNMETNKLEVH